MCTVSFIALSGGGYLLATNRDESPQRGQGLPPTVLLRGDRRLLAPIDRDAGGTWVAVDELGRSLCVLNGDRPAAEVVDTPPSRGLLALELMADADPGRILRELTARHERSAIRERAFKLIAVDAGTAMRRASGLLMEWDGQQLQSRPLESIDLVVSSRLDPEGVLEARRVAFDELLEHGTHDVQITESDLRRWHCSHAGGAPEGDGFSVCMHRSEASSVSLTLVTVNSEAVSMDYRVGRPCGLSPEQRTSLPRGE